MCPYSTLGVTAGANDNEIKAAYRKLVRAQAWVCLADAARQPQGCRALPALACMHACGLTHGPTLLLLLLQLPHRCCSTIPTSTPPRVLSGGS